MRKERLVPTRGACGAHGGALPLMGPVHSVASLVPRPSVTFPEITHLPSCPSAGRADHGAVSYIYHGQDATSGCLLMKSPWPRLSHRWTGGQCYHRPLWPTHPGIIPRQCKSFPSSAQDTKVSCWLCNFVCKQLCPRAHVSGHAKEHSALGHSCRWHPNSWSPSYGFLLWGGSARSEDPGAGRASGVSVTSLQSCPLLCSGISSPGGTRTQLSNPLCINQTNISKLQ